MIDIDVIQKALEKAREAVALSHGSPVNNYQLNAKHHHCG
jgi:hypothetical protein